MQKYDSEQYQESQPIELKNRLGVLGYLMLVISIFLPFLGFDLFGFIEHVKGTALFDNYMIYIAIFLGGALLAVLGVPQSLAKGYALAVLGAIYYLSYQAILLPNPFVDFFNKNPAPIESVNSVEVALSYIEMFSFGGWCATAGFLLLHLFLLMPYSSSEKAH